jgi:inosine/xanthosine triphosphate pyrophosphatase family protein
VVSLALPNGNVHSIMGEVEGVIAKKPLVKRSKGYPYRSFFFLPVLKKYYFETELTPEELKIYNHRYKAVSEIKQILKKLP